MVRIFVVKLRNLNTKYNFKYFYNNRITQIKWRLHYSFMKFFSSYYFL